MLRLRRPQRRRRRLHPLRRAPRLHPKALLAAGAAAGALAVAWALFFWLTGVVALWFALLFGVVVSGAVVQVSFGRGWLFQLIASSATVAGIVLGEALVIALLGGDLSAVGSEGWADWNLVFGACGVMGGFWVWKQPSPEEDA